MSPMRGINRSTLPLTITVMFLMVVLCQSSFAADTPTLAKPSTPAIPIKVPPGYTVEIAAAAPLVGHPMMAGFDDRGRLFIAENGCGGFETRVSIPGRP